MWQYLLLKIHFDEIPTTITFSLKKNSAKEKRYKYVYCTTIPNGKKKRERNKMSVYYRETVE